MKTRKNMVVVYMSDDWHEEVPLQKMPPTRKSFEEWHEMGQAEGIDMYRASIKWYDLKNNVFKKAWAYRDGKWRKITKAIKPYFIFDKIAGRHDHELFDFKMSVAKKVKIYNHPLFRVTFDNKLSQYLFFSDCMPKSILATSNQELDKALTKIDSQMAVIKPLYGSGGKGIIIDDKNNIQKSDIIYPVLAQEFLVSEGIPGFPQDSKVADLRMVFINHKFIYALSRVAKKGSLFTNFHQGASAVLIPEKSIPASALELSKRIVNKLSLFPEANYSLDFIFSNSRPLLLEMEILFE